jgi:hypothetical protein
MNDLRVLKARLEAEKAQGKVFKTKNKTTLTYLILSEIANTAKNVLVNDEIVYIHFNAFNRQYEIDFKTEDENKVFYNITDKKYENIAYGRLGKYPNIQINGVTIEAYKIMLAAVYKQDFIDLYFNYNSVCVNHLLVKYETNELDYNSYNRPVKGIYSFRPEYLELTTFGANRRHGLLYCNAIINHKGLLDGIIVFSEDIDRIYEIIETDYDNKYNADVILEIYNKYIDKEKGITYNHDRRDLII